MSQGASIPPPPPARPKSTSGWRQFFRQVLINLTASVVTVGVLLGFSVLLFSLLLMGLREPKRELKADTILVLDLAASINDAPAIISPDQLIASFLTGSGVTRYQTRELLETLDHASRDPDIGALVLTGSLISENYGSGWAVVNEVILAIRAFRESGKPVYAWLQSHGYRELLLASEAETVAMDPSGYLAWNGIAIEGLFFAEFLERNGIRMHVFEVGDFKGASDALIRSDFSEASREQLDRLVQGRWDHVVAETATARGLDADSLRQLAEEVGLLTGPQAADYGLVDAALYFDQFLDLVRESHPEMEQVTYQDYLQVRRERSSSQSRAPSDDSKKPRLGLIILEGDVVSGDVILNRIGGETYQRVLRRFREDDSIEAIVLRINSPGGVAFVAEQLTREIALTAEKKPVIASLGNLAASAGYMLALPAETIFADTMTLTGSIGVFLAFPDLQQLGEDYGITSDRIATGNLAGLGSILQPPNDRERALLEAFTEKTYEDFTEMVREYRQLTTPQINEVAGGRIWSGREALRLGLVDQIGGLEDALREAWERTSDSSEPMRVEQFPRSLDPSRWLESLLAESEPHQPLSRGPLVDFSWKPDWLPTSARVRLEQLEFMVTRQGIERVHARLPLGIE